MMDLRSEAFRRDPFPWYAAVHAAGPVQHEPSSDLWLVFDHAGVKRALTDQVAFSSAVTEAGTQAAEWLIFLDPPRHTQLRALIASAFRPRIVQGLESRIGELARELVGAWPRAGEVEVCEAFTIPLPMMVIAELLGAPRADWPRFREWADTLLRLSVTVSGATKADLDRVLEQVGRLRDTMRAYLDALLDERRARPREDLLSALVTADVDGAQLTGEELLGFFQILLVAGSETTTNLLGNALLCLADHPDALGRLHAEPALLPAVIEEVLRFRSPVQATFRRTRVDVAHGDRVIPAGKLVLAMIGAANRDPRQFPDADRFDVARADDAHLAFGHGIHFCLGAPLARLEARVALPILLEHLPDLRLTETGWQPREAFHVHGPARLPLRR